MSLDNKKKWCVVGGGILGLTIAHRLSKEGEDVTVIEAADRIGGLACSSEIGDITWDRHYHVTLLSDKYLRSLLEEFGIENQLIWAKTKTDFYTGLAFYSMNNVIDFLCFPALSFFEKIRQAVTIFYASRITNGRPLEQISLKTWLVKLSGKAVYEKIWLPLLRAKLGDNHKIASAAFIWAIIQRLYAARRSGLKTEMFGYMKGGYDFILQEFAQKLKSQNVQLMLSTPIKKIFKNERSISVQTAQDTLEFDQVVITTASPIATSLCEGLSDKEKKQHKSIRYQGIICASLILKKPLRGAYITYITDQNIPFTAVIEMSALVDKENYHGHSLIYLPCYLPSESSLFEVSDSEIKQRFISAFFTMYDHINQDDILTFQISRTRHVLAVSTLNYSDNLPPMQTSIPGVFIINSAQIVNGTLNVNETVKLANEASKTLLQ